MRVWEAHWTWMPCWSEQGSNPGALHPTFSDGRLNQPPHWVPWCRAMLCTETADQEPQGRDVHPFVHTEVVLLFSDLFLHQGVSAIIGYRGINSPNWDRKACLCNDMTRFTRSLILYATNRRHRRGSLGDDDVPRSNRFEVPDRP
jgi:hypothetical protein